VPSEETKVDSKLSVLIVEDSEDDSELITRELRRSGYELAFERVDTPEAMRQALTRGGFDLVISDHDMPQFNSGGALEVLQESRLDIPFIIVSGMIGEDAAVEAMTLGASDYIMKDRLQRLAPAVARELAEAETRVRRAVAEAEAQGARERLSFLVEQSPAVVYSVEGQDGWVATYLSENSSRLWGWEAQEFIRVPNLWVECVHPDDVSAFMERRRTMHESGAGTVEYRFRARDGSWCWIHDESRLIADCMGRPEVVVGVCVDVTARKEAEEWEIARFEVNRILASASTLRDAVPGVLQAVCVGLHWDAGEIWSADHDSSRLQWNGSWSRPLAGAESMGTEDRLPELAEGAGLAACARKRQIPLSFDRLSESTDSERPDTPNGTRFNVALAFPVVMGGDVACVLVLYRYSEERSDPRSLQVVADLGRELGQFLERVRLDEQLQRKTLYDELTGLPNRMLLMDRLSLALKRAERRKFAVGVFVINVDRFKVINDSLGRVAGDELLVGLAQRFRQSLHPDDSVARAGADEFIIVLEHVDSAEDVHGIAGRIAGEVAEPFTLRDHEVFVTVSMGVALGRSSARHPEDLIRDADIAMHRAKSQGRGGHVVFDSRMHSGLADRVQLESDLRHAMDSGAFTLEYQPIVDADTATMKGAEALVRWAHSGRGVVAPAEFIPVAEDTGLIVPMGEWILTEACTAAAGWRTHGSAPLGISVNLSPRQFRQEGLSAMVRSVLESSGLEPSRLTIEVTEGAVMDDPAKAAQIMEELAAIGVTISLDDFGTGYSSLGHLKRFPIGEIKVDASFVSGLPDDADDVAIVSAVIGLGHALGYVVVAEGVETLEQAAFLRAHACDVIQGYLYCKPLTPTEFTKLLTAVPWSKPNAATVGPSKR